MKAREMKSEQEQTAMRTLPDRIRHTLLFELIAITLMAFVGGWIIGQPPVTMGILSLILSVIAMGWNMVFNWLFDLWDLKYRAAAPRGVPTRIAHALLFEAGLFTSGTFLVAWWLGITLMQSLLMGLGFSAFFLVYAYAYAYNWTYDQVFPVPQVVR